MKKDNNKTRRAETAVKHTAEMASLYENEIRFCIKNSMIYSPGSIFARVGTRPIAAPEIVFENVDSVSAVFRHAGEGNVAVLNFASYKNPGGRFIDGSIAQEEALCHESFLYNVLSKFNSFYDWNNKNVNRGLYLDRAIFSPGVLFVRNDHEAFCDVITCASPNKIPAVRYHLFTNEENSEVLRERIQFIKKIAEDNMIDTLILGAFGCGVFMQDPDEVASVFGNVFSESTVKKIVFAVPGENKNTKVFRKHFGGTDA